MNWPIRRICLASVLFYAAGAVTANAQAIDPLLEINNQVDTSTAQALTSGAEQMDKNGRQPGQEPQGAGGTNNRSEVQPRGATTSRATNAQFPKMSLYESGGKYTPASQGGGGEATSSGSMPNSNPYSGYKNKSQPSKLNDTNAAPIPAWDKGVTMIESFNERNSWIGKGVTDTYSTQLGWSFVTTRGTTFTPSVSYAGASTGSGQNNTGHSNAYGAGLNIQQKILPAFPVFCADPPQPGAVYNVGDLTRDTPCDKSNNYPDHFPNCDVQALLGLSFQDANLASRKGHWAYDTQYGYNATPGIQFDYIRKPGCDGKPDDVLPDAVNLVTTYSYLSVDGNNGENGSNGLLSMADRNTWTWIRAKVTHCDTTSERTLSLVESNTLFHDVNQDPIVAPTGPIAYQNWARFGLAIAYTDITNSVVPNSDSRFIVPLIKLEYDYDACNSQYEGHTVSLTMNFNF